MRFLVPLIMWGWIPLNIFFFRKYPIQKAILISVIGGILFLPVASFDIPMTLYDKITAMSISLVVGFMFSGKVNEVTFKPKMIDVPIIIWCFIAPFLSIITNGLGVYNSIAAVVQASLEYGVFYMAGRIFFSDKDSLRLLSRGIIIGGLIYVPLVLFELRMSPQLSNMVYGFMPHRFSQVIRYGGYRPIVFMHHPLMVALWLSLSYIVSLWMFKTKQITHIMKIPMAIAVFLLLMSTILSKCAGAIVFLILGTIIYYYHKKFKAYTFFKLIIIFVPIYIFIRISGILPTESIIDNLSKIFDAERIESLATRLFQEEIFNRKVFEHFLFGWGWMDLAWPRDPFTGEIAVNMIDSLYLIVLSNRGFLGLLSLYFFLLIGPWRILNSKTEFVDAVVLSFILIFFTIDSLLNGMVNPVYILIAGSLITVSEKLKYNKFLESENL